MTALSILISLVTQALKVLLDSLPAYKSGRKTYNSNVIALCVALVVGITGTVIFFYIVGWPIDAMCIVTAILIGFAEGVAAMVGYDKVRPVIKTFLDLISKGE